MKEIFYIQNMNCNNCVNTISNFVNELDNIKNITPNLSNKSLEIEFTEPTTKEMIIEAIEDAGFSIVMMKS